MQEQEVHPQAHILLMHEGKVSLCMSKQLVPGQAIS